MRGIEEIIVTLFRIAPEYIYERIVNAAEKKLTKRPRSKAEREFGTGLVQRRASPNSGCDRGSPLRLAPLKFKVRI